MARIEIDKERCKGCELCTIYCLKHCIKLDEAINKKGIRPILFSDKTLPLKELGRSIPLDKDNKCTGCAFCAIMCPDCCITVYK